MHPVDAQVEAYNAHDLDRFVACYSPDVTIEDGGGQVHVRGREALRAEFAELFGSTPSLRAEIVTRIDLGAYVVMEERVLRDGEADIRGVMIYHVAGDAIDRAIWLLAR